MFNDEQKAKFLFELKKELISYNVKLLLEKINANEDLTKTNKTRINNILSPLLTGEVPIYIPEIDIVISNVSIYLDLLKEAQENNELKIFKHSIITNALYQFYVDIVNPIEKNTTSHIEIKEKLTFSNPIHFHEIKKTFLFGFSPLTNPLTKNKRYLEILSKITPKIYKLLSSGLLFCQNNSNNILKTYDNFKDLYVDHTEFSNNYLYSLVNLINIKSFETSGFYQIKNVDLKKLFSNILNENNLHFPVDNEKSYNIPISLLLKKRYIKTENLLDFKKQIETYNNSLISFLQSNYSLQTDRDNFNNFFKRAMHYIVKERDDNFNLEDFKIFYEYSEGRYPMDEYNKYFLEKYKNYEFTELSDLLLNNGFKKTVVKTILKELGDFKFSTNQGDEYKFSSMRDVNIYGASLDRNEFLSIIKGFDWHDVRSILSLIHIDNFFFSSQNKQLTLGLYSNYEFNFNRHKFVTVIAECLIEIRELLAQNNKTPDQYYSLPDKDKQDIFSKKIRQFILNQSMQDIKSEQMVHRRPKI